MKHYRTAFRHLTVLLLTVVLCLPLILPAYSDNGLEVSSSIDNQDFNLVLLIDQSGSMRTTDRSNLVKDAAKLFVDLCEEGRQSQISVISFDTDVYLQEFVTINDEAQREVVKKQLSDITCHDRGTDIGLALLKAVEYVGSESTPARKNMIVLFTDGYTQDLVDKEEAESEAQLQQALEKSLEYDCRIFTIGTNYHGSMNAKGLSALEGIRDFQLDNGATNTPEELLTIIDAKDQDGMKAVTAEFERIYATIGNRIIHEGNLVIESPNIAEANIIISAPNGVSEVVVTAPSGNSATIDLQGGETILDGAKIVFKAGKAYQLVKIIEPISVGTWLLNVADNQSNPILNYTWMLTTKVEITITLKQKSKKNVLLTVRPTNIEQENIPDFCDALTEKNVVVFKVDDQDNSSEYELNYNDLAACLSTSFPVELGSSYSVTVKVSDGYFLRTCSGTIDIPSTWKQPSDDESDFGTIYVWNWFSNSVDLSDRVDVDVEGCEAVDGGNDLAEFDIEGTILKVKSLSSGSEEIRIESVLSDGSRIDLTGNLRVLNPIFPILGGLLLIAGFGFLIFKKRMKRTLRGNYFIQFNVALVEGGQYTVPEVLVPCSRIFTLYDLMESYRRDVMVNNWSKVLDKQILDKKSSYSKQMMNEKFYICSDEQSFKNNGKLYRHHSAKYDWVSDDELLSISFQY